MISRSSADVHSRERDDRSAGTMNGTAHLPILRSAACAAVLNSTAFGMSVFTR